MPEFKDAPQYMKQLIRAVFERGCQATRPTVDTDAMVDRFLAWPLPKNFSPDGGITFKPHPNAWPIGTNLLNADQAKAMLEHVVAVRPEVVPIVKAEVVLKDCLVGGDEGVGFLVWLKIGNQSFAIGNAFESKEKEEAEWSARMLREALERCALSPQGTPPA